MRHSAGDVLDNDNRGCPLSSATQCTLMQVCLVSLLHNGLAINDGSRCETRRHSAQFWVAGCTMTCPMDRPRQMSEITVLKGRNLLK